MVVVASLASAWLAVTSNDGLVAEDYYKQGLLINTKLRQVAATRQDFPNATLTVGQGGRLTVLLDGITDAPRKLSLTITRPGEQAGTGAVALIRSATNEREWNGVLPALVPGRLVIALASERWQLPTTTLVGPFTVVRMGVAHHQT